MESSSEEEEEEQPPIIEFTAVSPQKPTKAQQRASQLTVEELEKKWNDDVSQLIEEADDQMNIVQDKKAEEKKRKAEEKKAKDAEKKKAAAEKAAQEKALKK